MAAFHLSDSVAFAAHSSRLKEEFKKYNTHATGKECWIMRDIIPILYMFLKTKKNISKGNQNRKFLFNAVWTIFDTTKEFLFMIIIISD